MTYSLSDCVESINQILNYPSVTYGDISIYFDQAISELNTELHLGLKPISVLYKEADTLSEDISPLVVLDERPNLSAGLPSPDDDAKVYFDGTDICYLDLLTSKYVKARKVYGIYIYVDSETNSTVKEMYQTIMLGNYAYWTYFEKTPDRDLNLTDYMPYDWVVLFLIPYVCFKYAIRDGDSGASYAEDLSNGFQQLRNAYSVPSTVCLSKMSGKKAYAKDVLENLPNLNISVPTRAIYEDMRTPQVISAEYESFYDKGGWGF